MTLAFIGEEDNTQNMLSISLTFHQLYARKLLLFNGGFMKIGVENAFLGERSCYIKDESIAGMREGMDYLIYRSRQGLLNPLVMREGLTYLAPDFAYIKAAIHGKRQNYIKYFNLHYKKMRLLFEKRFEYVMADCGSGCGQVEEQIIRHSDVIIYNANLDDFLNKPLFPQWLYLHKPVFYLFGHDDFYEQDKLEKVKKAYRMDSSQIAVIPSNTVFLSKMESGMAWNYFQNAKQRAHSYLTEEFLKKADLAAEQLMKFLSH